LKADTACDALEVAVCILTAARTGEVIGAQWAEIDLEAQVWTVPADRMKAGREHRVPLSDRAIEILAGLPRDNAFVFDEARAMRPIGEARNVGRESDDEHRLLDRLRSRFPVPVGDERVEARSEATAAFVHRLAHRAVGANPRKPRSAVSTTMCLTQRPSSIAIRCHSRREASASSTALGGRASSTASGRAS